MRRFESWPAKLQQWQTWVAGGTVALLLAGGVVAYVTRDDDRSVSTAGVNRASEPFAPDDQRRVENDAPIAGDMAVGAPAGSSGVGAGAAAPGPAARPAPGTPVPPGVPHDKVIKNGSLRLSIAKNGFRDAFDRTTKLASELGGFVANSSTERVDDRLASGTVTLRIPEARFDEARTRLGALGEVEHESVTGQDVTGQLIDLDARLRSLRAQEDVLRTLLGRARNVGEVIQVQEQLGNTRLQIEQLAAEQKRLEDQVAMATLEVSLAEAGAGPVGPEPRSVLRRSVESALGGALAVIGGSIVVIGYAFPVAVLLAIGWFGYRLANRRRARPEPAA